MLATLFTSLAAGEMMEAVGNIRRKVIYYSIAALLGLAGIGFFVGAAYIWAERKWGALSAAVGFGVVLVVVALLLVLFQRASARVHARKAAQRRSGEVRALASTAAIAIVPALLSSKRGVLGLLIPAAALAGYAIFRENYRPRSDRRDRPPYR